MTKKKTLLNESSVRQFMKLADLKPLSEDFVSSLYTEDVQVDLQEEEKEEDKMEEASDAEIEEGMYTRDEEEDKMEEEVVEEEEEDMGFDLFD